MLATKSRVKFWSSKATVYRRLLTKLPTTSSCTAALAEAASDREVRKKNLILFRPRVWESLVAKFCIQQEMKNRQR
jgi:hypothetical protein